MVLVLLAAGLAVDVPRRAPPPSARWPSRRPRSACSARSRSCRSAASSRSRPRRAASTARSPRPGDQLTDPDAGTPANTPDRLTATSSVRAALLARGARRPRDCGAARARAPAPTRPSRTRFRDRPLIVRHAHGYVVQTLADLGLVGLALSLALLGAWLRAAAVRGLRRARPRAAVGRRARRPGRARRGRAHLRRPLGRRLDLVRARQRGRGLLCAGWVAGRGPLRARVPLTAAAEWTGRPPAPVERHRSAPAPAGRQPDAAQRLAGPGALPITDADWRPHRPTVPVPAAAGSLLVVLLALAAICRPCSPCAPSAPATRDRARSSSASSTRRPTSR